MIDTIMNQPVRVLDGGLGRPYIILPVSQVERATKLFDDNGIIYQVDKLTIAIDDQPANAWIHLNRKTDTRHVQALLDSQQGEAARLCGENGARGDQANTSSAISGNPHSDAAQGPENEKHEQTIHEAQVFPDEVRGPYIILPAAQVAGVRKILDANGVGYWVSHTVISVDGKPPEAWIFLKHKTDPDHIQALIDAA